jgi:Ca-activated chloride channel family protein
MDGDKIVQARQSAIRAIDQLHKGDKVSVVLFSTGATALLAGAEIGKDDVNVVKTALAQVQANGGTDMIAGLETGGQRARALFSSNRTNRVLLLSDGHPNTSQGLEERIAALAKEGILTTTLGLGRDYNEDLMSKLADAGLGNYHFIENANQLAGIFEKELRTLGSVVAKEAVASIALKDGVEVVEVYGYSISRGQRSVAIPVGDVFGGRRADILAKVRFPAAQVGSGQLLEVKVTYHDALAGVARKVQLPLVATFTKDQSAVTASVVPAVLEKAETVRTAEAMKAATEAYARGERERAQAIVKEQKQNLSTYNAQMAGSAYAPAAAKMQTDFDALEAEAEDAKTDKEVLKKRAKAAARTMSR